MKLWFTVLWLLSTSAFASGKLTLKGFDDKEAGRHYDLGLSIYEVLPYTKDRLAYVSWTGSGYYPNEEYKDSRWYKTEQGLEVIYKRASLGAGAHFLCTPAREDYRIVYYGSLSYKLWN